jgi:flagella basal body P-ring formation protein FlgA
MRILIKTAVLAFLLLSPVFSTANEDYLDSFTREVRDVIDDHFANVFALEDSNLVIDYPIIDTTFNIINYDEIKILPTRKRPRKGVQMITCGLFSRGRLKSSFRLKVRVKTYQTVVVTDIRIKRQEHLTRKDVKLAWRETSKLRTKVYTHIADVLDKRSRRVIQSGEILTESVLEELPLIPNGSRVTIYFNSRGVEVVMPGKARQDGHLGKKVLVWCLANKRSFTAVVLDSESVRVDL